MLVLYVHVDVHHVHVVIHLLIVQHVGQHYAPQHLIVHDIHLVHVLLHVANHVLIGRLPQIVILLVHLLHGIDVLML
jgi:hypothetical protein